jgi:2-oxoglutarate ferredoxin oxidoreductase subunit beta
MSNSPSNASLSAADFSSDQQLRWCPSCGDFAILKQMQMTLPRLGIPRENIVFVSGIGCSSRFPYYMNTFGMHSIHGRAPAIATGLKLVNPDLSVWIITGDGDGLSIGGNHLIHLLRRNPDVNVLLFNNQIYGLTKGQYSPTSEFNKVTKSTPFGSVDHPFNPLALVLGADAGFIARTMDKEARQMQQLFEAAHAYPGTAFIEIYQNCNIFNDNAFEAFSARESRKETALFLEEGKPLVFGKNGEFGIKLDGHIPRIVSLEELSLEDLWIHDSSDFWKAQILVRFFDEPGNGHFPRPFGLFYSKPKPRLEQLIYNQLEELKPEKSRENLRKLLRGGETWTVS